MDEEKVNVESIPYIFSIKNVSDDKLYNVDLFNNKDNRCNIMASLKGANLDEDIEKYSGIEIGHSRIVVFHDYKKFLKKQIRCSLNLLCKKDDRELTESIEFQMDSYQQQEDQVDGHKHYLLHKTGCYCQVSFNYLMPEAEIMLYLYPASKTADDGEGVNFKSPIINEFLSNLK